MEYEVRTFPWVKLPDSGESCILPEHSGLVLPGGKRNVFTPEECARIIKIGATLPEKPATTGDGANKVSYSNRKSRVRTFYPADESNWIFEKLEAVVTSMVNHFRFDLVGFYEGGQLYHYPEGGFLNWHMDIGHRRMSTRKLAITVQLTPGSEYEGGDLEFEDCEQSAPREQGAVIIFPSYMRHRVTRITKGNRASFVSWVHGPPFR